MGGERALRCAGPAPAGRAGRACSRARGGAAAGQRVRRLPHRPAPAPTATSRRKAARASSPGTRWSARSSSAGPGVSRFTIGDRVGIAWLRSTCGECRWCRRGRREPLPRLHATPAGTPTAGSPSTPSYQRRSPTGSLPGAVRRGRRAAAVRRDHRLPGPAPRAAAARGPARHLRLRGQRPPHRADRHRPGRRGARADPGAAGPRAGARARGGLRRRGVRRAPRAAGRGDHLRPGRRPGAGGAGRPGPWRHARRRGHPPQRHPAAGLPAAPVPGADADQRHGQHPRRR